MSQPNFGGSVPRIYHDFLGPFIFDDYAKDLAGRLRALGATQVLETACGTGIVTCAIAKALPPTASLTATDLSPGMLEVASEVIKKAGLGANPHVALQTADACSLPFVDGAFDAIACQFGAMFFPDKIQAMREARRVLKAGGSFIFSVWDSIEHNPITRVVHETVTARFPSNPPNFITQLPYGWFDRAEIERITRAGGFANVTLETRQFDCSAPTAADAAKAWIEGTPIRASLADRGVTDVTDIREEARAALAKQFGDAPCRSTMRAVITTAW